MHNNYRGSHERLLVVLGYHMIEGSVCCTSVIKEAAFLSKPFRQPGLWVFVLKRVICECAFSAHVRATRSVSHNASRKMSLMIMTF